MNRVVLACSHEVHFMSMTRRKKLARSPNVLVFFTDQQRHDTTGVHGNPMGLTPNFDRLAERGTHVENSFTCQPVCGPARSCLQTGRYATQTGCWRNGIPLAEDSVTLAKLFGEAGYDTAYFGKWHLGPDASVGPVPKAFRAGYDTWLASNVLELTSDAYSTTVYDKRNRPVQLPGYRVDAITDAVIRYFNGKDRSPDQPFFSFVSYLEPHHQNSRDDYPAPAGYEALYAKNTWVPPDLRALGGTSASHLPGYYGMVKRIDEALGRTIDALTSLNLLDDTIILFTSDHGNHFKTRNHEYKRSCHDASLRVPTALCGPGFDGGGRVSRLVSLVDLPPTLLDACGIPVPSQMSGRSIRPLLNEHFRSSNDWPDDVFAQVSESQVGRVVRTARWKYSVTDPTKNGWKESASDRYTEAHLYDLKADPWELNNLVGKASHDNVTKVMRERLKKHLKRVENATPKITPAPPTPAGQAKVSDEEASG